MTNRVYRLLWGLTLLIGLYFELPAIIYGLAVVTLLEGITGFTVPRILSGERYAEQERLERQSLAGDSEVVAPRFAADSERVWRVTVGVALLATYFFYASHYLWFFPWFIGFAVFGAGVSGVCPVLIGIRWIGFR